MTHTGSGGKDPYSSGMYLDILQLHHHHHDTNKESQIHVHRPYQKRTL
jgi:hypothetical protein